MQITKEVGPVLYNFAAMMDFDVGGGVGQVLHQKVALLSLRMISASVRGVG